MTNAHARAHPVPQPDPSRLTPFAGHPIVVGVTPGQPELVVRTATEWASALGVPVWFAYADPTRLPVRELPDGTVQHEDLSPDAADDSWRDRETALRETLADLMASSGVAWEFRYLAGRPDRALTHLARLLDAAAIVVGTKTGRGPGLHELLEDAVGQHLAHHQHRPVLLVPLTVVDWKTPLS